MDCSESKDFMHDDVTRPEGSMEVEGKIIVSFGLSESSNKSLEPLLDG